MYLDNNASTPTDPEINDIFQSISMNIKVANPHSAEHAYGWNADKIIEEAQQTIGDFINSLPQEVYFTSGATEANNLAIIGTALSAHISNSDKKDIIVSAIEHKCVLNAAQHVKDLLGFNIIEAPITQEGTVDIEAIAKLITKDTLLVSIMMVNNEIGTKQPINEIGKLCKNYDTIFHVDAAQGIYCDFDVIADNIDMLSLSGHKIYAPKGIGVLYISDDITIKPTPIIHGGNQQNAMRAGTLSPALCASMAKAIQIISDCKDAEIEKLQNLRALFLKTLDDEGVSFAINGNHDNSHPGNCNIQLHGVNASTLITRLQPQLAISTGSACNSGAITRSYVLKALGLNEIEIDSAIRIGFGRFNTDNEVTKAAKLIADEIQKMNS